jgi:cytochrome c553
MALGVRLRRLPVLWIAAAAVLFSTLAVGQTAGQSFEERVQLCGTCHGEDGNSKMEKTPSLAGQPELFLTNQLILMRDKLRQSEVMAPFVKGLTDADIVGLSAHYAKLSPRPTSEPADPALVERGTPLARQMLCGSCHLPDYAGREHIPRLAGQRIDYTVDSLVAYREGKRYGIDTTMNGIMYGVSDQDIRALAHYLASIR